jgi:NAD(P)-dependent dehydrogenase (short-subunit alcohol dehydrogenase family)
MTRQRSMLVTGGASGIGRGIALAAAGEGYRVGVIDVVEVADGDGHADDDAGDDGDDGIAHFIASVADEPAVEAVLDEFGTPDVVVNNAGIVRFGPLLELTLADFRTVIETNLEGTYIVARAAARRWIPAKHPGNIINVTSMNGVAAGPNSGAYGASKAAVALLTSQMGIEWGPHGIRVNAVAPGLINAGMSAPIYADPATRALRESKVPLRRLGTAEEIADVVLFLASERSSYVHGQNIVVDGGVTGSMIAHLPRPSSVDSVGHGGE